MAGHIPEIVGIIFLLIFAVTMFYHGWHIFHENGGYSRMNTRRDSERMRTRIEQLLKDKTNDPD
jgi:hypothetical protein